MKILCLPRAPLDYIGGIPAYCVHLYKNSVFDVHMYSYDINKSLRRKVSREVNDLKETVFPSTFVAGTFSISFKYLFAVIKNSPKYKYIHIQLPDPFSVICVLFAKMLNPKLIIIISWHAEIYKKYLLLAPLIFLTDLLVCNLAQKIIFFTEGHLKRSILSRFKFLKAKVIFIPNCVPTPSNQYISKNFRKSISDKKTINILSIGRLVGYKGYEYALEAIKKLDKNIRYQIIGEGPQKNKLNKLIKDLKLEKKVTLLGYVSNDLKEKLLSKADIFLFPSISQSEAYGLVQLEAMFYALPIINTDLKNGVNYLAPDGVAITCPIKNSKRISKAISSLINNEKLYENMSKNSLENVKNYDLKKMQYEYEKIFI